MIKYFILMLLLTGTNSCRTRAKSILQGADDDRPTSSKQETFKSPIFSSKNCPDDYSADEALKAMTDWDDQTTDHKKIIDAFDFFIDLNIDDFLFICDQEKSLVGSAYYTISKFSTRLDLHYIGARPSAKRSGTSILYEIATIFLLDQKLDTLELKSLPNAVEFYKRTGFICNNENICTMHREAAAKFVNHAVDYINRETNTLYPNQNPNSSILTKRNRTEYSEEEKEKDRKTIPKRYRIHSPKIQSTTRDRSKHF